MHGAAVRAAVAEERRGKLAALSHFSGQAGADRQVDPAADNAVRAQHSHRKVGDMHGTAFAFAIAGGFAEDFRHHRFDFRALADAVAVAAMRAGNVVVLVQFG